MPETGELIGALLIGIAGGMAGGLLGIGGGTVFVPGLVLLLGIEQHTAQGISLIVIIPTALSATYANVRAGNVDGRVAAWVTPIALVFAVIAAQVAGSIDGDTLSRIFGAVVLYVGTRTLYGSWRSRRAGAGAPA